MKILEVSNYKPTLYGGLEAVVYHLSKMLSVNGNSVKVLTSTNEKSINNIVIENFAVIELPSYYINYRIIIPKKYKEIFHQIKSCDIVHIHSPNISFALLIGFIAKILKKSVVLTVLTFLDGTKHPTLYGRLIAYPMDFCVGLLASFSDYIHVLNHSDYRKIYYFNKKIRYIPNGLPSYFFTIENISENFFKEFGLKDKKIILYVGRLDPFKGPQKLVPALKELLDYDSTYHLVFVGKKNDYFQELYEMIIDAEIEANVSFTGGVSENMKISAYDAAKVVVVPSRYDFVEAFSIVASEAWSRNKPVVGGNIGALKERIVTGENGYLINPEDPLDIAEKIQKAVNLTNIKIPKDVISWEDASKIYVELFKNITED